MISSIFWLVPAASLVALIFAWYFYKTMMKSSEGTPRMQEIAQYVREGAMAYLRRQYTVVGKVFLILVIILAVLAYMGVQNPFVPIAFLTGGFFSGLCGYLGMKTATNASARTAQGASISLNKGLQVAFRSGAVMGLVVVGFGLLDIAAWFLFLTKVIFTPEHMASGMHFMGLTFVHEGTTDHQKLIEITTTMLTFGMGASTQALFARVGGGIYTKAADVGADLVGKVEAGIPEDDPRNPATIADNVGDNVGDVAGMGADLYESYCGSILATAALGATLPLISDQAQMQAVLAPMIVAAIGILLSILGIFMVRTKESATQKNLLNALLLGTGGSSVFILAGVGALAWLEWISWGVFGSVVAGLVAGVIIGQATEYFTSDEYGPTKGIAKQAQQGPATTIIDGIAVGMYSTWIPVITIVLGIIAAYGFAGGFSTEAGAFSRGVYGIGFAAVGMLATLGITLATDAFGPIADNAGGNAEMAHLPKEVRERTDALDMLGNTTAATGKGFAIGSAALTALALLSAYIEEIKIWLSKTPEKLSAFLEASDITSIQEASIRDFVSYYDLSVMNPLLLGGMFLGAMMAFLFCAMTMKAVGRAAGAMVDEVRRQFRDIAGIMEGTATPDYARCVDISTRGAQREMLLPSLLAIIVPVAVGILLGVAGVIGLLAGGLTAGFTLAVMLNNSGGAWDNAKKYVEKGNYGGKGSPTHKAAVVGDTVGDPFKDTSGPSLNILIKLMTMVSVVMAGLTIAYSIF
ncbi:K(+)-stimulated pyrophosphate-energized sodium pump [Breznakibacter xylanolyticus]|uniref:Putative K(+)-stimulated pyrophosphate-energized sodium pump n=1 Tax=Breznakibacter xylanolyticus TaxID=990 RepID=A0A2W7NB52_9BACT|nr:sodium-translocating pyrophosphatase [Breznakibacter xylanolyticus]PZX16873.1 K(+)-stimulated pyrophosphate-energized sodium pump [Breznakibacter xylanolyticus]